MNILTINRNYVLVEDMESSLMGRATLFDIVDSNQNNIYSNPIIIKNTFKKHIDFTKMKLSKDADTIMNLPNAGGNSIHSEALSCEVLGTMFNAKLIATELELQYYPPNSKITDYSITINDVVFGVSVTRAMKWKGTFTTEDAERLLTKKLYGVIISTQNVLNRYKWDKQILHIWAQHKYIADILIDTYKSLPQYLKSDTVVIVTICEDILPNPSKQNQIIIGKTDYKYRPQYNSSCAWVYFERKFNIINNK